MRQGRPARFVVTPFTAERMTSIGNTLIGTMKARIGAGLTANDTPAPPLSKRYGRFKKRRYGNDLRNMQASGKTLEALAVLRATTGRVEIGFNTAKANLIAAINARRSRQFGVSPGDSETIGPLFREFVTTKKGES